MLSPWQLALPVDSPVRTMELNQWEEIYLDSTLQVLATEAMLVLENARKQRDHL